LSAWAWSALPSCELEKQEAVRVANLTSNSEKLLKLDARTRNWDITVIGEESHLAYNRVGLTSFFDHRRIENLYLNPKEWVRSNLYFRRTGLN
jgi:spermidine/putrescine-binding protein